MGECTGRKEKNERHAVVSVWPTPNAGQRSLLPREGLLARGQIGLGRGAAMTAQRKEGKNGVIFVGAGGRQEGSFDAGKKITRTKGPKPSEQG